jgi:LPXTG-site transpeptidase (sortase) family protein
VRIADHAAHGGPVRRSAVLVLAALLLAVLLPWVLPGIPRTLGNLVQGAHPSTSGITVDPTVQPPAPTPEGGVSSPSRVSRRLAAAGPPRWLRVQRLGVRSAVVPISGQSGVLLPPSDPQVLGWWQEGKVVGAAYGSAVLTGHTVHTGGGAFDHLRALVPGDRVVVRTAHGRIRYAVTRVHVYDKAALARQRLGIFRQGGPGRLVLVTCSNWNGTDYDTNTVVFARPVAVRAGR